LSIFSGITLAVIFMIHLSFTPPFLSVFRRFTFY
jgi:hypothetical protein